MNLPPPLRRLSPFVLAEWFAAGNLAFLGVDIYLAHLENDFARREEYLPLGLSLLAPLLLLPGLLSPGLRVRTRPLALAAGLASVVVGAAGMVYHLESGFFGEQSLRELVYTAPFVAPLAYVGVGLLVLLNHLDGPRSPEWGPWVVLLALGGWVGNLGLSLLDHAQNGFFSLLEWVPVGAAAFGCSFLLLALWERRPAYLKLCLGLQALEAAVGVLGFLLHAHADALKPAAILRERVIFGAPVFAPLLFANLALLAAIGLWAMLRGGPGEAVSEAGGA